MVIITMNQEGQFVSSYPYILACLRVLHLKGGGGGEGRFVSSLSSIYVQKYCPCKIMQMTGEIDMLSFQEKKVVLVSHIA